MKIPLETCIFIYTIILKAITDIPAFQSQQERSKELYIARARFYYILKLLYRIVSAGLPDQYVFCPPCSLRELFDKLNVTPQ